ncbi:MAG: PilZ domain-containing protein [Candidatus Omnitrophota bacterium]
MVERREHPRVLQMLKIKYKQQGEEAYKDCTSRDVSLGGIGLIIPEEFKPGQLIELEIKLPGTLFTLFIKGKIIWCFVDKKSKGTGEVLYRSGIMFLEMPEETKNRLKLYLQLLSAEQENP